MKKPRYSETQILKISKEAEAGVTEPAQMTDSVERDRESAGCEALAAGAREGRERLAS